MCITDSNAQVYMELVGLCYVAEEWEKSVGYMKKYVKINPNDAEAHINLGMYLIKI